MVTRASVMCGKSTWGTELGFVLWLQHWVSVWPWASCFLSLTSVFLSVKWGHWTWSASRPDVAGKDIVGGTENAAVFQNKVPVLTDWWLGSKGPDLARKNTGYSVQFEFHVYNKYYYYLFFFFFISIFHSIFGISCSKSICCTFVFCCIFVVSAFWSVIAWGWKSINLNAWYFIWQPSLRGTLSSIFLYQKTEPNEQQQKKPG